MATHSSVLAWRIPWTEEPGGLQSVHGVARSWTRLSCQRPVPRQVVWEDPPGRTKPPRPSVLGLGRVLA